MSIEKKINEKHSLNLTAFAAPTQRAMQAGSTQEVYDLMDNNFYNPNWGYQTDENGDQFKRNAKIRRNHEPKIILNHYFDINSSTKLNTALSYSFGYEGTTSLNWYNSYDPRPDYYRYLPSYCTDATAKTQLTELWKNNSDYNQIDWDRLYYANYLSKLEGKQANYIVEERRDDHNQISLNTNLKKELSENIKITAGIELKRHVVNHYKVINDLLGADYWVDIDQFSERDFPGDSSLAQNDINNPNKKIYKGDRFGYDYNMNVYNELLWAQAEFTYNKFDFFVAANASGVQYWRTGNMLNGRNPDNSYGDSEKQNFIDYGAKGGFTYKITGRHFVTLNAGYSTEAPSVKESYLSPRIGADLLPNLQNQQILTGDISYIIRTPIVKGRLTAYHTTFNNQTDISSFYHDEYRTFVNFIMQDVDKEHNGVELGAEIKATQTISATIGAAYGDYRYTSRPNAIVNFENGSRADTTETIFIENFHVAGTPQMGGSIGIKYSHPKYWFFNANFNYIGKSYLSFNPERRTDGAIPYNASDSIVDVITEPMLLEAGYTVDVSIGKSLIIKGVNVSINFSVSNLLNNQSLITGGYEQMRYDFQNYNINKFPPKYFYGFGRNYFLNINVRF
jgi:hypothetical protein